MLDNKKNLDENNCMNSKELKEILKKHVEDNFSLNRMYTDLFNEVQKMFKNKKLKDD